jgi:hypothetical protein
VLQEAPELAYYSAVEGGGMEADGPREQVREQPGDLAQEGAFGFYPSELPKERKGEDFGIRELLEGGIVPSWRVEVSVGVVVDLAEQDG